MEGGKVFILAGFFLLAMIGVKAITPSQDAWAVDLNVDLTPDRDSQGIDVNVAPDNRDRDIEQERRFHDQQQERHEQFHEQQDHDRFHRDLKDRDRSFNDSAH